MAELIVEVPGKLVLLGEYAVLDGAPALSIAVEHGVRCHRTPGPFAIHTPTGDDRFARAALGEAPAAVYTFSDLAPLDLPGKPGMGGSGAAVVAALIAGGHPLDAAALTAEGIAIHRAVQGSGSGIDVATSAHGGGIRFLDDHATPITLPTPVVLWAGNSAKTGPRVKRYQAWSGRQAFVQHTAELVDGFTDDPIEATRAAWRALCAMADASGVPYRTPTIDRIVADVEAAGGAAKPSGAGGGDAVIAFGPAELADILRDAGHTVLDVQRSEGPRTRYP